jgi:para-nitrobenzyl esterase
MNARLDTWNQKAESASPNIKIKDELLALLVPDADQARKVYDPLGDQTLDELEPQVFGDQILVRPARNLANVVSCSGQPVYYRFALATK